MPVKDQLKEAIDTLMLRIKKLEEAEKEEKQSISEEEALTVYEEKANLQEDAYKEYEQAVTDLFDELRRNKLVKVLERQNGDTTSNPRDNVNHTVLGVFGVRLCLKYDTHFGSIAYDDILKLSDEDIVKLVEKNMDTAKVNEEKFSRIIKSFEGQIKEYEDKRRKTFFLNFKRKKEIDEAIDTRRKSIEHYQSLIDSEQVPEYSEQILKGVKSIQESVKKAVEVSKKIGPAQKENSKAHDQLSRVRKLKKALEAAEKSIVTSMRAVCGYDKGIEYIKKIADNEKENSVVREIALKIVKEHTKKETR